MDYELRDFQKDILEASNEQPVLVDFWATWCQPCKVLGPILEKMAGEAKGRWKLVKVDVDQHQALAHSFQVQSIPQVFLVHEGQIVDAFAGQLPENKIREWLEPLLPPVKASSLDQVKMLIDEGKLDEARAQIGSVLAEKPDDLEALVVQAYLQLFPSPNKALEALRRIEVTAKQHDRAEKLIYVGEALVTNAEQLPVQPNVVEHFQAAIVALKAQRFEETLDQCLEVLYRDKAYHEGAARKLVIGIFEYLGRQHAVTRAYQRRFEMAMF